MSLFITSLNSGSNGNCYYVGNEREAVLIDAGITCRETEKRMHRLGLSMDKVKAIFISHEHGDHIKGVEGFVEKYRLPIYITAPTLHYSRLRISAELVKTFKHGETVRIGDLSVVPFSKLHDASDPHSFVVAGNGVKIGVFTDIGAPCENLITHFRQCHAAFLEANYDDVMLDSGNYPIFLKNRIRGGHGHLSNMQAMELYRDHRPPFMSYLLLAHLSKENNDPDLARLLFSSITDETHVVVASRYKETAIYQVRHNGVPKSVKPPKPIREPKIIVRPVSPQMSLF